MANGEQIVWAEDVSEDENDRPDEEEDEDEDSDEGSEEVNAVAEEEYGSTIRSTPNSNL